MNPRCLAIVVSYNSGAELPECLAALSRQQRVELEIVVVDNASRDRSVALVKESFPAARLIANRVNVGFGRANNQALLASDAPFVALVNPDAIAAPDAIATCVEALLARPDDALAATRLTYPDGSLQPSCHGFLNLANLAGEAFMLDRLFPRTPLAGLHMRGFDHRSPREVDWIQGAFLVGRGDVLRGLGGFDPDYFMYGEEMDLCLRIRRKGGRVLYLPEPPVVHAGGASSQPIAGPMFVEVLKSRVRFFTKHRGAAAVAAARALITLATLVRWAGWELLAQWPLASSEFRRTGALRVRMFRAGMGWILRGMPLTPPSFTSTGPGS